MSSATPLCDLCLTTSVWTFDILLFCTCLGKFWASWILLAPGSLYFLPVLCPVVSGQKMLPILVAHPKITDPSHSLFLPSYPEDLPQPLHIPLCCCTTWTQLSTGKSPLLCHLIIRAAFSALRVGMSSQEKNSQVILFTHRIARESCTHLVGWVGVPTRRLGTSPDENSSPLDEGGVISVCEWLRWMVLGSLQSSNTF